MSTLRPLAACAAAVLLSACAVQRPPEAVSAPTPPQWYSPLPHNGTLTDLTRWWQQFDDPLLMELIVAAQTVSPTVAGAASRIEQARAIRTAAGAALLPTLDAQASAVRANQVPTGLATTVQGGLQTAWEIDLFGANRGTARAAQARLEGAEAGWHEARVSVAAETANSYINLRTCERQLIVASNDAKSRAETARLTELSAQAGFTAPARPRARRARPSSGLPARSRSRPWSP
jgi:outer membrane protein TolC